MTTDPKPCRKPSDDSVTFRVHGAAGAVIPTWT